ncbi:MAG: tetratricopeptide repeat protein [Planctomycetes bacterium]|nr:tetratricopeptide repeat protein [Planctomycetota bacterium]
MSQRTSHAPLLHRFYGEFLASECSASFIQAVTTHYSAAALERLARSQDRITRRAAVLALGLTADYSANEALGRALTDEDRAVRMLAENGLRAVSRRQGSAVQRRRVEQIIRLNRGEQFAEAIVEAGALLRLAPWIAEAWRQRGLAYYHQGRWRAAIGDFSQAIELNPFHFGAALGRAHGHLQLDDVPMALEWFERALRINPNLEGVRVQVHRLQRALQEP